jgi:ParB-like chromosome segregation protein Spo0J
MTKSQKRAVSRHPVSDVRWVPIEKVRSNDYNPNRVAAVELQLLYVSIKADGYTQPIVTVYDAEHDQYVIVDGFHRYRVALEHEDIRESTGSRLPVVVIDKPANERMASTVRHNRARGKHGVGGMAQLVYDMLDGGWTEAEVCTELGMSADEVLRLKHISGVSKLAESVEYRRAWETRRMAKLRRDYEAEHPGESTL